MSINIAMKCAIGAHALCHTRVLLFREGESFANYAIEYCNAFANWIPSPIPKVTYFKTVVGSGPDFNDCSEADGKTLKLAAGNITRIAFMVLFPRFAMYLGTVALALRLITCFFSSDVRATISHVIITQDEKLKSYYREFIMRLIKYIDFAMKSTRSVFEPYFENRVTPIISKT